ncbi:glycosyltransferase family protein [Spirosoma rhododendri]|uniref:Mannosyltransferase n=1 Tax=Spirosoma rhododendri TaxID=2728024 RepID=A0A7L5DN15_9BACT|nr:hypothetical protein [Spirosoma rhododendri]QJD79495.1 hypothetical protein HH216_14580 [Spirosoma rhododendri]
MEHSLSLRTDDARTNRLLLIAFVVQLVFCLTQVGFLHPDQHFQLIEFSSWQLGEPSGAGSVWELKSHIRPTVQVYIFSGFVVLCRTVGITDAYTQLTILRVLFGMGVLLVFNRLALHYFRSDRKALFWVLLLLNFSWSLPYVRTLFSSELASSVVFFGAILIYERRRERVGAVFLVGLLFSLAFYLRFQMAFGLVGFGLWLLMIEKGYSRLLPMAAGFVLGVLINTALDYQFYHQLVYTPYDYFRVNILEGKAAEFGTAPFYWYIVMLALVVGAPPVSLVLFYYSLKSSPAHLRQPLLWVVAFFVLGHCLVGHKEERFLFPVINAMPIIAGWGLPAFSAYYQRASAGIRLTIRGVIYVSVALNVLILVLFLILNPYYQLIEFGRKLNNRFSGETATIYCLHRTPFETESHLPLTFYRKSVPNLTLVPVQTIDSVRYLNHAWLATTYNDAKGRMGLLDSLGYKPQLYSSTPLWQVNTRLDANKANTINEIWVLYRKE